MDPRTFAGALERLDARAIRGVAACLAVHDATADAVDDWRAILLIDRSLRRSHGSLRAAHAAHDAAEAVQRAATRDGIALPDDAVTCVARAAAEIARGLAAGADAAGAVEHLLAGWRSAGVGGELLATV